MFSKEAVRLFDKDLLDLGVQVCFRFFDQDQMQRLYAIFIGHVCRQSSLADAHPLVAKPHQSKNDRHQVLEPEAVVALWQAQEILVRP